MNGDDELKSAMHTLGPYITQLLDAGWTDDEILHDFQWRGKRLGLHDRRLVGVVLAEMHGAASEPPEPARGPSPRETVTLAALERERAERCRQGQDHGYDTLADALGVHPSTVVRRYRGRTPPGDTHIAGGRHY